jgi:DNA-directed RNA polymerase specialized sigma24 family protein
MCQTHTVTELLAKLKAGEQGQPQQELWNRYFTRLVALARQKLGQTPRRAVDEEDIVLSALNSFFTGISRGKFPQLKDRNELWPLLVKITMRKVLDQRKHVLARRRGEGHVYGESYSAGDDSNSSHVHGLDAIADDEPTPESVMMLNEQCRRLVDLLPNDLLKLVVRRKLDGLSNEEIAVELNVARRTIERKLKCIREIWSQEDPEES